MPRSIDHIPDLPGLARRLKERREAVKLSQRQLAFPGCTAAYISRLEAGARHPSRQMIDKLAERLGTTREWLETGHGPEMLMQITIDPTVIELEMARMFPADAEDVVTWSNLDDEERAAVIKAMEAAALAKAGAMALPIAANRQLHREALERLNHDLSERLASAVAEPEGAPVT